MNIQENIKLAIRALKGNMLRSILTLLMIVVGIAALIGILTSIEAIKINMTQNFVSLGAGAFTIQKDDGLIRGGRQDDTKKIKIEEAEAFKERFAFPSTVSIYTNALRDATVKSNFAESNPNITIEAADENYIKVSGKEILMGRGFSITEIQNGSNVAIVGYDLAAQLFESQDSVLGAMIAIDAKKYKIIGLLASKGATAGKNDSYAILPYKNAQREFDLSDKNFDIIVEVNDTEKMDWAAEEATGLFRSIRMLGAVEEDNFFIVKSDKLAETLMNQMQFVSIATMLIGALTLIGAGVGLMNIMLVSVNERTREIGISKSIGATSRMIFLQFLIEAIVICLLGGILGIIIGVAIGNLLGMFMGVGFIFPLLWVIVGLVFCTLIGLVAGSYPASRASALNPVEALRYEG
ncbi:MAG: ABC transporter permease [Chitinophagales bacterium]